LSLAPIGRAKEVKWKIRSETDKRWNKSGTDTVAMVFQTAPSAEKWLKECEHKFGKRPKGLQYHCEMI